MRRFYNKGAKGLSGGQVKLDKMGNNDGKISGEDFAVMRSRKMGGGMMKRPMYKAGSANPKAKSKTSMKQAKAGMESQKSTNKKVIKKVKDIVTLKSFHDLAERRARKFGPNAKGTDEPIRAKKAMGGGMMEEAKEINSKIKNSRTLKMGGGRVKRAAGGPGLYANIKAKQDRIKSGSGEKMKTAGSKGAPTTANFKRAAQTAKA